MKYLGLSLSLKNLRHIDFQPLEDKAASKLATWKGKLLTPVGRTTLAKSVLLSQMVYLIRNKVDFGREMRGQLGVGWYTKVLGRPHDPTVRKVHEGA